MRVVSTGSALTRQAGRRPDAVAITCGDESITFAELDRASNRFARAYDACGVRHGDLVTIALPNSVEFMVAAFAIWKLGATPQPVSHRLPDRELHDILELANPSLIVGLDNDRAAVCGGRRVVGPRFTPEPHISSDPLEDRVAPHLKAPTSGGSTGRPKIILSGQRGEVDLDGFAYRLPVDAAAFIPGPLYHNAPFSVTANAVIRGNHVVNMARFDPSEALALIARHRARFAFLVPTMMHRIWRLPDDLRSSVDLSCLDIVLHMAAPCPEWLKRSWIDWLGAEIIHELYAGTEAQAVTWVSGGEWLERPGTVGRPITGEIRVLTDDGRTAEPGEIGEIYMRPSDGPTYRYLGAEPRTRGEWESLGDIGWMDGDGYLYLADRRTDLIIRGGANIYPAEVEAALDSHPRVRGSVVLGLPDDEYGQRVHAVVDAPTGLSESEIRAHVDGLLVRYKQPASYDIVDRILWSDAGKVRRSALREEVLRRHGTAH